MDISLSDSIAVIADIHGNSDALAAVLRDIDAQGVKQIINLGDHFSGPLAANETAEIISGKEMLSIRGNHDRLLFEQSPNEMGPSDKAAFDQLNREQLEWLKELPPTLSVSGEIFLCHGTPDNDSVYWMETVAQNGDILSRSYSEIEAAADGLTHPLILCAHTHIPRIVRLDDGRLILNPGSVGLPAYDDDLPVYHVMQTGSPDARYALVQKERDNWQVTFRCVPYDTTRMAKMAINAGRPDWARALATGWF